MWVAESPGDVVECALLVDAEVSPQLGPVAIQTFQQLNDIGTPLVAHHRDDPTQHRELAEQVVEPIGKIASAVGHVRHP